MRKKIEKNTRALLEQEVRENMITLSDVADMAALKQLENGTLDAVLCLNVLHKCPDGAALNEIYRILKNEGFLAAYLKPYAEFRTQLKALFDVNCYYTKGDYAWFQAQKRG